MFRKQYDFDAKKIHEKHIENEFKALKRQKKSKRILITF